MVMRSEVSVVTELIGKKIFTWILCVHAISQFNPYICRPIDLYDLSAIGLDQFFFARRSGARKDDLDLKSKKISEIG